MNNLAAYVRNVAGRSAGAVGHSAPGLGGWHSPDPRLRGSPVRFAVALQAVGRVGLGSDESFHFAGDGQGLIPWTNTQDKVPFHIEV